MDLEIKQDKFCCYLLLCVFILYYSQGFLLTKESVIGPILFVIICSISVLYVAKMFLHNGMTELMRLWLFFIGVNVFYFLITADYANEYNILRQILLNFLPFFPFYHFAKKQILTRQVLILFVVVLLPILTINFLMSIVELKSTKATEHIVDNRVYPFIGILPFILLFRKKMIVFGVLLFVWFIMIQSNKRSAIICGLLAFIFFIFQTVYGSKSKVRLQAFLMAVALLIGITYFGYSFYDSNIYLQQRIGLMLEGNSSGRDELLEGLFTAYYQSDSYVNYFFGLGFNSSRDYTENVAHNDWIDMLGSFGLFGLIVYFFIWRILIKETLKRGWDKNKKIIMLLTISIAFIASMVFRWYQSPFSYMNAILIPYLLATRNYE